MNEIMMKVHINSMTIEAPGLSGQMVHVGDGLFLSLSIVDHSCDPMAGVVNEGTNACLQILREPRSPDEVVTFAAKKLGVALTKDQRAQLLYFLNNRRGYNGEITNDPYDNTSADHRRDRGLRLYFILGLSPDFQTK